MLTIEAKPGTGSSCAECGNIVVICDVCDNALDRERVPAFASCMSVAVERRQVAA
jgi:hypothetical protein